MTQSKDDLPSVLGWQVTTTTVWCSSMERRVTLVVKSDWSSYCCCYEEAKGNKSQGMPAKCEGPGCSHIMKYRNRLIDEERKAA